MDTKFYVGQRVKCPLFGKGVITGIMDFNFIVIVDFDNVEMPQMYRQDGSYASSVSFLPTLEPDEPEAVGIAPEWNTLDEKFKWVAIDPDGVEIAFIRKPQKMQKYMHGCNAWVGRNCQSTGRFIDMKGIDWTKTLSKRPVQ